MGGSEQINLRVPFSIYQQIEFTFATGTEFIRCEYPFAKIYYNKKFVWGTTFDIGIKTHLESRVEL